MLPSDFEIGDTVEEIDVPGVHGTVIAKVEDPLMDMGWAIVVDWPGGTTTKVTRHAARHLRKE